MNHLIPSLPQLNFTEELSPGEVTREKTHKG